MLNVFLSLYNNIYNTIQRNTISHNFKMLTLLFIYSYHSPLTLGYFL